MWASEFKPGLASAKWRSIEDYMAGMDQIIPVALVWAQSPIPLDAHRTKTTQVEALFVAFKSNEIACFLIHDDFKVQITS
jgi:hypothetical protein